MKGKRPTFSCCVPLCELVLTGAGLTYHKLVSSCQQEWELEVPLASVRC